MFVADDGINRNVHVYLHNGIALRKVAIQSEGLACNLTAGEYVIAEGVWHHALACILLRIDSIQHFVLIPYRRRAADSIHGFAVISFICSFSDNPTLLPSRTPRPLPLTATCAVIPLAVPRGGGGGVVTCHDEGLCQKTVHFIKMAFSSSFDPACATCSPLRKRCV